jgi:hypothetical protein
MMKAFWEDHNIKDLEEYLDIIRASISRPSVMMKRQMMSCGQTPSTRGFQMFSIQMWTCNVFLTK